LPTAPVDGPVHSARLVRQQEICLWLGEGLSGVVAGLCGVLVSSAVDGPGDGVGAGSAYTSHPPASAWRASSARAPHSGQTGTGPLTSGVMTPCVEHTQSPTRTCLAPCPPVPPMPAGYDPPGPSWSWSTGTTTGVGPVLVLDVRPHGCAPSARCSTQGIAEASLGSPAALPDGGLLTARPLVTAGFGC
jgi:hypothetical protein